MEERIIEQSMIEAFKDWLCNEEKSRATIAKYIHDVQCFINFAREQHIDKAVVIAYKSELEKEYAIASANSMIAALNAFFRFVGWTECCVKQFKVQRKAFCSEEKELTKAEYMRLLEVARHKGNERLNLIIQTICGTGIRVSELQFITVKAVKRGEAIVSCKIRPEEFLLLRTCRRNC